MKHLLAILLLSLSTVTMAKKPDTSCDSLGQLASDIVTLRDIGVPQTTLVTRAMNSDDGQVMVLALSLITLIYSQEAAALTPKQAHDYVYEGCTSKSTKGSM